MITGHIDMDKLSRHMVQNCGANTNVAAALQVIEAMRLNLPETLVAWVGSDNMKCQCTAIKLVRDWRLNPVEQFMVGYVPAVKSVDITLYRTVQQYVHVCVTVPAGLDFDLDSDDRCCLVDALTHENDLSWTFDKDGVFDTDFDFYDDTAPITEDVSYVPGGVPVIAKH